MGPDSQRHQRASNATTWLRAMYRTVADSSSDTWSSPTDRTTPRYMCPSAVDRSTRSLRSSLRISRSRRDILRIAAERAASCSASRVSSSRVRRSLPIRARSGWLKGSTDVTLSQSGPASQPLSEQTPHPDPFQGAYAPMFRDMPPDFATHVDSDPALPHSTAGSRIRASIDSRILLSMPTN